MCARCVYVCTVCVCVCVYAASVHQSVYVCTVCVCVRERERERERLLVGSRNIITEVKSPTTHSFLTWLIN